MHFPAIPACWPLLDHFGVCTRPREIIMSLHVTTMHSNLISKN
jgi:hypothetical protein